MDYLKNHTKLTLAEYTIVKDFIVVELKSEYEKGHIFEDAITNIKNLLHGKFIDNNFVHKHPNYFGRSLYELQNPNSKYNSKKVDPIVQTLKNATFDDFTSSIEIFKTEKIEPLVFENLTFENFYPEILKLVVYKRCYRRIDNSIAHLTEAFKLFYENNNYEEFTTTLLQDDEDKITVELIKNIFKKFGRKLTIENLPKGMADNINEISKHLIKYKSSILKLTKNEMILLFYICTAPKYQIDQSELIKLVLICGSIENDYKIFDGKINNSTLYNLIIKAKNKEKDKTNQINMINSIIEKIEIFNLPKTTIILKSMY
jgi:ribosome-associated toxin RatA of RatAB toxin-antitoxin module